MRRVASALVALACMLVLAGGASGRGERIPWLTFNEVTLDGHQRVLSKHDVFPEASSFSSRRRQLAYIPYVCDGCRSNQLFVADVDGPGDRLLFEAPGAIGDVAWSPDGRTIALIASDGPSSSIWVIGAEGESPRRVQTDADGAFELSWSPNSRALAVTRRDRRRSRDYIATVSVQTGDSRYLTRGFAPQWSPNGRQLLYEDVTGRNEPRKIRVVPAAGGRSRTIARGGAPVWSPNGKRIAFLRYPDYHSSIWTASIKGGPARLIANDAAAPVWSSDSRRLAFERGGHYCGSKLSFARVSGGRPRRLVTATRLITPLAWSRTGRKILYAGERCSDQ